MFQVSLDKLPGVDLLGQRDKLIDREQADSCWGSRGGEIEKTQKKLMRMDNSVVIAGGRGRAEAEECAGGVSGDGRRLDGW